ncbi:MAG TPA: hypothetical protein VKC61_10375 [Pyrinomonadaceae bacterium]|nr:hypothetical protein [Pyrinomonadaceae bacterium]
MLTIISALNEPAKLNEVKRSAALGHRRKISQARFSGRQILSPAKAGSNKFKTLTQGSTRYARFTLG